MSRPSRAGATTPAALRAIPKGRVRVSRPAGVVRIIAGQWKRSPLPVADKPGLRPTPQRVRETLFNWLGQDLTGWRCIDVFAGTGALGLEAASRGAALVTLVEQDAALVAQLLRLKEKLKARAIQVQKADGLAVLQACAANSVELVLLDPPFEAGLYPAALSAAAHVTTAAGYIYLEAPTHWSAESLAPYGLQAQRHLKAGAVHAHLLQHL